MPFIVIPKTTDAVISGAFNVSASECPRGIAATNLQGDETVTLLRDNGDGVFLPVNDARAVLTASESTSSIIASGVYKFDKTETEELCLVSYD